MGAAASATTSLTSQSRLARYSQTLIKAIDNKNTLCQALVLAQIICPFLRRGVWTEGKKIDKRQRIESGELPVNIVKKQKPQVYYSQFLYIPDKTRGHKTSIMQRTNKQN